MALEGQEPGCLQRETLLGTEISAHISLFRVHEVEITQGGVDKAEA